MAAPGPRRELAHANYLVMPVLFLGVATPHRLTVEDIEQIRLPTGASDAGYML
jgi:hypothetical protein